MEKHSENDKIREATVAGIFYPEDPAELKAEIERLISLHSSRASDISPAPDENSKDRQPRAIFSPHAGFTYSGDLSALAWSSARKRKISRVVVLSPIHRPEEALVFLPESDCFATPFGFIDVDRASVEEMLDCGTVFSMNDIPHFEEHGVEVQLPFMHYFFPDASLVPILVGSDPNPKEDGDPLQQAEKLIAPLSKALNLVFSDKLESTLFVLSSDLSSGPEAAEVKIMADETLDCIEKENPEALLKVTRPGVSGACGATAIAACLESGLLGSGGVELLGRHDSASKRESARENFVEYAALAFF